MAATIFITKKPAKSHVITVRINGETLNAIDTIASDTHNSRNDVINKILDQSIDHIEISEK